MKPSLGLRIRMIVAIPAAMACVVAMQFIGPRDSASPTPNPATGQVVEVHPESGAVYYATSYQVYRGVISSAVFLVVPLVILFAFRRDRRDG